ncbi:MAG: conjugal transfer protein TraG N-terminal domain-containing protein, partial [Gammaproteobacteria bacterium]|nr:conjugal transfer protein TraG N-terminal domain-containing protein [Gammaproteobacteria bacterium]
HATIEGLPRAHELRQTVNLARMAQIEPPSLKSELAQFYNDCYVPSRSKYFLDQPSNSAIDTILDSQGLHDIDWVGSHVYRQISGYYDTFRASEFVTGWPFDRHRDTEYDGLTTAQGRPMCKEWWEHNSRGLRRKIIDSVDQTARGFLRNLLNIGFTLNSEAYLDVGVKAALMNAPDQWSDNVVARNNLATDGWIGSVERSIKGSLNTAGIVIAAGVSSLVVGVLVQLLPILQAILLMGLYALLPVFLVVSRYSFFAMMDAAVAIFTIKFWTVLWYMVLWIDQNLIESMYPDSSALVEVFLGNTEHAGKRLVLNVVTTLMYIGLPILWATMMGWAGSQVSRSVQGMTAPYQGISQQAGSAGSSLVGKVANRI